MSGHGSYSAIGGNKSGGNKNETVSHEYIENMFDLLQSVDMGYQANDMISLWRDVYEKIRKGEPFHPSKEEGALINGFIINYHLESLEYLNYRQSLDMNVVQIPNSQKAASLFRDWAKEKFDSGEYSYTDTARQIQKEEKEKAKHKKKK